MATAQAHTAAPQFEARLRHALPLGAHLMVGLCECVVTHIPVGGDGYVTWNYGRRGKHMFRIETTNVIDLNLLH